MRTTWRSLAVASAGLALAITGCGASTTGSSGADEAGGVALKAEATVVASGPAKARPRPPMITSGKTTPARAKQAEDGEKSRNPETGVNPCSLVSRAKAQAIVGSRVAEPNLAPQGPTCVYATPKQSITLALLDVPAQSAAKAGRSTINLKVGGKRAYCVDNGSLRVLVPLNSGKTLVVGAGCPIAARFATEALRRLGG